VPPAGVFTWKLSARPAIWMVPVCGVILVVAGATPVKNWYWRAKDSGDSDASMWVWPRLAAVIAVHCVPQRQRADTPSSATYLSTFAAWTGLSRYPSMTSVPSEWAATCTCGTLNSWRTLSMKASSPLASWL
jgi:hypothetical protein